MKQKIEKSIRKDWTGGLNPYLGVRQIKDNESPDMANCDFYGKGGVGSRLGYTKVGTTSTYTTAGWGLGTLHTNTYHQMLKFIDNGVNVVLATSTDGAAWSNVTGTTFVQKNIDGCQAAGSFYIGNGSDAMKHWDGAAWNVTTNGTLGYYPTFYNNRIWVVDETYPERINFSGQWGASDNAESGGTTSSTLGSFSDATAGWISFRYGSGTRVKGLKVFKNALYVFLSDAIYSVAPASAADTFTVTLITNSVGCVSHRSIAQVEEDLMFAADDGVYSLGEVANYTSVRTTNKSAKVIEIFNALDGGAKAELCAEYYNFKYHLFYSSDNTTNNACIVYDIRYKGWMKWTGMNGMAATLYEDSNGDITLNFLDAGNAEVYEMYSGSTDNGTDISSYYYTKSFDEDLPDTLKVYFDHTFIFQTLNGTVSLRVIYNDLEVAVTKSFSQLNPIGGMARQPMGYGAMGIVLNGDTSVTNYIGTPRRFRSSKKRFAVQYKISSSDQWQLDTITTTFKPLSHYSFPSLYKLN
jgi:hypothetical protein